MYKQGVANGHTITRLQTDLKLSNDKINEQDAEIEELKKAERIDTIIYNENKAMKDQIK